MRALKKDFLFEKCNQTRGGFYRKYRKFSTRFFLYENFPHQEPAPEGRFFRIFQDQIPKFVFTTIYTY